MLPITRLSFASAKYVEHAFTVAFVNSRLCVDAGDDSLPDADEDDDLLERHLMFVRITGRYPVSFCRMCLGKKLLCHYCLR